MRLPNWQLAYADLCAQRQHIPFAWGSNDCALFAADVVLAITGIDHGAPWRGYTTARQALRHIQAGGGLAAMVTAALGEPIAPNMAKVGDVVLIHERGEPALAVCNGGTLLSPGRSGLVCQSMSQALMCWRVA